ncbi:aldo/keto reductase [Tautonia marina]|uniref:aldo/keto reductase n=1 Tax=Tautonia marina TaxID=2653855 RepID=UPI001260E080|nr:aldo/keto reductase [Tautonia marina]
MKRRTLIGGLVGGLATGIGSRAIGARPMRSDEPGAIPKRTFGKTGVDLTIIGLASGRFPVIGNDEEAIALTRRAVELGINYFDTAHNYWDGHSEEIFGEVLPACRDQVFLTTKSTNRTKKGAEEELHLSLKRLKTDYVDLWQVHGIQDEEDVEKVFAPGGAIEAFEAAKKAGKCRFIGFTGHTNPAAHLAMLRTFDRWDTILMPLHVADPHYLSFEQQVLPLAVEQGLGIQGMKNFANAKLLQRFSVRDCLSYVLNLPIHCTAVGCTTLGQLEDDVRIAQSLERLGDEQMAALRSRAEPLKGPRLEDWKDDIEPKVGHLPPRPRYTGS